MGPEESEWFRSVDQLDFFHPEEENAGLLQSLLYFGLIAVISNKTIDGNRFSTRGKRWPTIVSSQLVASALIEVKINVLRLPRDACMELLQRHKKLLVKADSAVRQAERHFTRCSSSLIDLILLSVKILIGTIVHSYDCALDNTFDHLCGTPIQWCDIAQRRGDRSRAAHRELETKMMQNGWCIHQAHKILSTFSYQTAYYFARLPRPRSARLGHDRCSRKSCKGWDSNPGNTHACHVTDACACSTISVSSADVAKIIRSDRIPLVSIEEDVLGNLSLKLHTKTRYVQL